MTVHVTDVDAMILVETALMIVVIAAGNKHKKWETTMEENHVSDLHFLSRMHCAAPCSCDDCGDSCGDCDVGEGPCDGQ